MQEQRRIVTGDMQLQWTACKPFKTKEGETHRGEVGGAVINKKSTAGDWELEAQCLLTAELSPGEESIFLPLNDGGRAASHSAGDGKYIASYWGILLSGVCMRAPPSGLLIPFQWRFLLLIFRWIKIHWIYCLVFSLFLLDYWKFWSIKMLCFNR